MGTQERKAREKARVRRQILDAARQLFTEHGYEAVTMRRIAEKVEYTPTTLYLYFENKTALLQELSDLDALALAQHFQKLRRLPDLIERLYRIGEEYVRFALRHPSQYRLIFMTPAPPQPPEKSANRKGDPDEDPYAVLTQAVEEAIAAGLLRPELKDVEMVAQVFWSGTHGIISLFFTKQNDPWIDWRPLRPTAQLTITTTLRGLLRNPDQADALTFRRGSKGTCPRHRGRNHKPR